MTVSVPNFHWFRIEDSVPLEERPPTIINTVKANRYLPSWRAECWITQLTASLPLPPLPLVYIPKPRSPLSSTQVGRRETARWSPGNLWKVLSGALWYLSKHSEHFSIQTRYNLICFAVTANFEMHHSRWRRGVPYGGGAVYSKWNSPIKLVINALFHHFRSGKRPILIIGWFIRKRRSACWRLSKQWVPSQPYESRTV